MTGNVGDVELPLLRRDEVVREDGPVHVEDRVERRDDEEPGPDAEGDALRRGHDVSAWKPQRTVRSRSSLRASDVEDETDDADEEHAGHDEIVALARVARVDDEVAEARVDGDHLGGDDDDPRDAERDPQADEDLRQRGREDDAREEPRRREAEVAAGLEVHRGHAAHSVHRGDDDGEEGAEEDQEARRRLRYAEPQDRERHPRERADRARHLDDGVEGRSEVRVPAEREARRNAEDEREE